MARTKRSRPRNANAVTEILVLDAEGVSKAADGDESVVAWIQRAKDVDADIVVSAVTLAEVLRSAPRDATRHRVLKFAEVWSVHDGLGRQAGALLGAAGSDATIDALIAATALAARERLGRPRVVVLTSDPDDLRRLLADSPDISVAAI